MSNIESKPTRYSAEVTTFPALAIAIFASAPRPTLLLTSPRLIPPNWIAPLLDSLHREISGRLEIYESVGNDAYTFSRLRST